jgi:mannose-6-phosphate isomerase-like protein (cupin superfamily)
MKPITPYTEKRPWGNFERFTQNEISTVKIITVAAGGELSLQYHAKRAEFWKVLSGAPVITVGEKVIHAKVGDEFFVAPRETHRIQAGDDATAGETRILEVALGEFDETDIVRLEDKYGRT